LTVRLLFSDETFIWSAAAEARFIGTAAPLWILAGRAFKQSNAQAPSPSHSKLFLVNPDNRGWQSWPQV